MESHGPFQAFRNEVERIVQAAERRGVVLRLMGGAAIKIHCPRFQHIYDKVGRVPKHDMDFITYSKHRGETKRLFTELGYEAYKSLALLGPTGRNRQVFTDKSGGPAIDLFFDRLEMAHRIDFRGRLDIDSPTLTPVDLLLQKLQIVKINEKDVQDSILLLREHSVGSGDREEINSRRLVDLLSKDWGFHYTSWGNLNKIKSYLFECPAITAGDKQFVLQEISKIEEVLQTCRKAFRWRIRSLVGPRIKWYTDVEELKR